MPFHNVRGKMQTKMYMLDHRIGIVEYVTRRLTSSGTKDQYTGIAIYM